MLSIVWSQIGPFSYVSPGVQIGFNSNDGLFYGLQLSIGFSINEEKDYPFDRWYIPSICYGFKRFYRKYNEQYIDFQVTSISDVPTSEFKFPIGLGIGKNFSQRTSNIRLKGYTWYFTNFTLDFNIKQKSYNFSLIPVIPIG
tara:strand:+ start:929 stop:1354 length:426 start_codon:yes stop_codon:yes gene_type:complete